MRQFPSEMWPLYLDNYETQLSLQVCPACWPVRKSIKGGHGGTRKLQTANSRLADVFLPASLEVVNRFF